MTVQIVILAMIAAFLGLRLYSVLGRRAEHEDEPIQARFDANPESGAKARPGAQPRPERKPAQLRPDRLPERATQPAGAAQREMPEALPGVERGLREIANADRRFDGFGFLEGAREAYRLVLEAFWSGDKTSLAQLCDKDVYDHFVSAIDARLAAGETLENRLVRIEDSIIVAASYLAPVARISVRYVADIAAVTRNSEGVMIAGSLDDAVEARDVWSFSRDIGSPDPDWLLDETDEG